jgi:hypothetical protein
MTPQSLSHLHLNGLKLKFIICFFAWNVIRHEEMADNLHPSILDHTASGSPSTVTENGGNHSLVGEICNVCDKEPVGDQTFGVDGAKSGSALLVVAEEAVASSMEYHDLKAPSSNLSDGDDNGGGVGKSSFVAEAAAISQPEDTSIKKRTWNGVLPKRKSFGWARRKNSKTRIRYMEAMTSGAVVANDQPEVTANEDVYVEDHAIPAVIPQSLLQPPSAYPNNCIQRQYNQKRTSEDGQDEEGTE